MNTKMRNLTLSAAALAALTGLAPAASADDHGRNRGRTETRRQDSRSFERRETPRQTFRGNERREVRERGDRGPGRGYVAPRYRYDGYRARYVAPFHAPFRVFSGFHFYSAFPGPGYVYIANYGWVLPPFFGAVWVPGHYDIEGFWVDGFWR